MRSCNIYASQPGGKQRSSIHPTEAVNSRCPSPRKDGHLTKLGSRISAGYSHPTFEKGVMDVEIGCILDVKFFGITILVWILIDYGVF